MSAPSTTENLATPDGFAPGVDSATLADLPPELIRIILQNLVGAPFADPDDLDFQYRSNPPLTARHWRSVAPLITVLPKARQIFYAEVERLHLNFSMCSLEIPKVLTKCPNLRHLFIERAVDEKTSTRPRSGHILPPDPTSPNHEPAHLASSPKTIMSHPMDNILQLKSSLVGHSFLGFQGLHSLTLSYCYNVPEALIRAAARGGSLRELRLVACNGISWEVVADALHLSPITKLVFAPAKFAAVPDSTQDLMETAMVPAYSPPGRLTRSRKRGPSTARRAVHPPRAIAVTPMQLEDSAKTGSGFREIFLKQGLAMSSVNDLTIGGLSLPDGWAEETLVSIGPVLKDSLSRIGKLRVSGLQFRDLRCLNVARTLAGLPRLRHLKLQCLGVPVEEELIGEVLVLLGQSMTLRRVEISVFDMEPLGMAVDRLNRASFESQSFNKKVKFEFAVTHRETHWKVSRLAIWNTDAEIASQWVLSEKADVVISDEYFNRYYRHDSALI